jgi:hypothetical protein
MREQLYMASQAAKKESDLIGRMAWSSGVGTQNWTLKKKHKLKIIKEMIKWEDLS